MSKFLNVLLVEDDPITVMVCDRIIKMNDFATQVQSRQNGAEAIQYLKTIAGEADAPMPELIFLDINMPVMNGWDFLQEFQNISQHLPNQPRILILSSTVDPEDYKKAGEFPVVEGFISKPLTGNDLANIQ
jgi:CheY-like chemotaxis protein